jgi:hypothetical protein
MSDWGQGAKNNNIGWGQGAVNNDISWGASHLVSYSRDTDIVGQLGLLDEYAGAAAAYSLRSLSVNSTNVVRVRRDSDNAEQDFTASQITNGTLAAFVGSGNNGFVTTWYDQSGSNNATQTSASAQPKIYDSVTGLVLENGIPALDFDGDDDFLSNSVLKVNPVPLSIFITCQSDNIASVRHLIDQSELVLAGIIIRNLSNNNNVFYYTDIVNKDVSSASTNQNLMNLFLSDGSQIFRLNGTETYNASESITNNTVPTYDFRISGDQDSSQRGWNGRIQEIIIYKSDQSFNSLAIETNINDHYNIY